MRIHIYIHVYILKMADNPVISVTVNNGTMATNQQVRSGVLITPLLSQARSQTLKKRGANNHYKQGLIWSSLERGSGGAPPGKFLTLTTS